MWKSETLSYFVILNESNFFSIGANACVKLKQFEEAIIWCEKGLAVSFLRRIQISQYNIITSFISNGRVYNLL